MLLCINLKIWRFHIKVFFKKETASVHERKDYHICAQLQVFCRNLKTMSLGNPYNYFEALDSFDFKMINNGEIIN